MTLMELLAATAILALLGLILNAGLNMALRSYRDVTARSEAELLLSTAVDAVADDLRYARNVEGVDGVANNFTYTSDSFGAGTGLDAEGGQIRANGKRVLPTGAYGLNGEAYKVEKLAITPHANNTFTIDMTVVATADESVVAKANVTVRCLNPMNLTTS